MLSVRRGYGNQCDIYRMVQQVRSDISEQVEYDFDRYSYHYVLCENTSPVGALSAQRAVDGQLDCEEFYPPILLSRFKHQLFSTCKMRIQPHRSLPMEGLRMLVRDLWMDQLSLGCRITVINATEKLNRFYQRIGFSVIPSHDFIHPVLGTQSQVMVMAADPGRRSFCQDLYGMIADPVSQSELIAECVWPPVAHLVA